MNTLLNICTRYSILLIIGISNLVLGFNGLFYLVFTPLTIYPVFSILNYIYGALFIEPNVIFFKGYFANITPACVAGSAYFFILILNLITPMSFSKRMRSLLFIWTSFLILNILRIVVFSSLVFRGYKYFNITHLSTWYFGSTLMVVLLWFGSVKIFDIKTIPAYSDFSYLINTIKHDSKKNVKHH
jgi:hypothetical protein